MIDIAREDSHINTVLLAAAVAGPVIDPLVCDSIRNRRN
jgi:hypothetical protein